MDELSTIELVALVGVTGLLVETVRWGIERRGKGGRQLPSFVWGWLAVAFGMLAVTPIALTGAEALSWRILPRVYQRGITVGIIAIAVYDLALKPAKRYVIAYLWRLVRGYASRIGFGAINGSADTSLEGGEEVEDLEGDLR